MDAGVHPHPRAGGAAPAAKSVDPRGIRHGGHGGYGGAVTHDAPAHPAARRGATEVAARLVAARAYTLWHAGVRRDPLMRLFARGYRHRYRLYERLRAEGPVVRSSSGLLTVVSHPVADGVLRSRDTSIRTGSPSAELFDLSLLAVDPPDHTRLRALVAPAFTARRMRLQGERIRAAVERLADDLAARLAEGPVDLMDAFARPLPVLMITGLLGIRDAPLADIHRHGHALGRALDGVASLGHHREIAEAEAAFGRLVDDLVTLRRREPDDDIVSHLVRAADAGTITGPELAALVRLLLVAGFETTVNLIGNAVACLLDRPDLWARLVDDPGLAERVVDETLRHSSPVQVVARTPTRDLDIAGHLLPEGTPIVVAVAAANRDPDIFPRPAEFDLDRPNPRDHLAFGAGVHHCVGRPLAEMEARLALVALARHFPHLRRAAPEVPGGGTVLLGRDRLPVRA